MRRTDWETTGNADRILTRDEPKRTTATAR